jgi:hypothetical protein
MAGLGYKSFSPGEVLTAANLQGYAVDQSVMVFDTSAARAAALPFPSQGMVAFLQDSGTTWQYFDLYNVSTNPGGAKTAGWYPTGSQAVFYGTATRSTVSGTSYAVGNAGFTYSELWDQLAWRDPSTNPDRIIPKSEGLYRATVSVQYAASGVGNRFGALQRNGSDFVMYQGAGANLRNFSMTGANYMNGTTDYFNVGLLTQDSGGALAVAVQVMVEYVRPSIV